MTTICRLCNEVIKQAPQTGNEAITHGICPSCSASLAASSDRERLLDAIHAPVLLMQGNPRQVVSANRRALSVFGKSLAEVEDKRGGQVFDCEHSFSEAGCGKDVNCEHCAIKNAIVDTFNSGTPHSGISAPLQVRKTHGAESRLLQVSTEKIGDLALVRIEHYDNNAQ